MNHKPPLSNSQNAGSLRIGPFWKRAAEMGPGPDEPFDALTDLFLGEVNGARGAGAARSAPPPHSSGNSAPADGPTLRLAGDVSEDEYQLAPAPATSTGEVATRPATPVLTMASARQDECQAKPIVGAVPPTVRTPVLELLVLGNLPVLAGAWANQYVREIAEAAGKPVAYLRVQGGFVGLELVGALADVAGAPGAEELESLDAAIDAAAEMTDRWVVRCDSGQEGAVAASRITRAVTVLTGTDQMAREACRATCAGLAGQLASPGNEGPMVRLAMMGASAEQAKSAGAELTAIARSSLSRPVAAIACAGKIGGVRPAHPLYSGPGDRALGVILASVERALVVDPLPGDVFAVAGRTPVVAAATLDSPPIIDEPSPEPAPESLIHLPVSEAVSESAPEPLAAGDEPAMDSELLDLPLPEPKPTTAEIATGAARMPERLDRVETIASTPAAIVEAPARSGASVPDTSRPVGSLALLLPELKPISLRCPYAESIEMAMDAGGSLHLLARSESEGADDTALAALLVASSWTASHAALLAQTLSGERASHPTLHLFTDRPKRSRRLLETDLRVHVLAQVMAGGQTVWYTAELN